MIALQSFKNVVVFLPILGIFVDYPYILNLGASVRLNYLAILKLIILFSLHETTR